MENTNISLFPVDHNDHDSEGSAIQVFAPADFCGDARDMLTYLGETAFIFWYKGRLVLTDESLALTVFDGVEDGLSIHEAPRWTGKSMAELEAFLAQANADRLKDMADEIIHDVVKA